MILLVLLVVWAIYLAIAAFGAWIIMLNVNDIFTYYAAGSPAPFWPFFWIILVLIGLIGGGSRISK